MTLISLADLPRLQLERFGAGRWAIEQDGETLGWAELERRSNRRARALMATGVGKGDFVTLALPNGFALVELLFAIWKIGATPHIVSPKLPRLELAEIIELARPRLVVAQDPDLQGSLNTRPPEFGAHGDRDDPLPEAVSARWKAMSSGGSTGRPKIIVAPAPSLFDANAPNMLGLPEEGVVLSTGPLSHNMPLVSLVRSLLRGLQVVVMAGFDPEAALRLIQRHKVGWTYFVPTMMQRISRLPPRIREEYDVASLDKVWHWAAPMPPDLKREWIDWLGPDAIWELYGGTEGIGTTIINGREWLDHPGSVGRPWGNRIRILDEDGSELPPGAVGEIYSLPDSGPASTYEYIGAERRTLDGKWDSLGDQGWLDEEGYLYIADRRTDLIVSGGANIYPAEVEAALMAHPGVEAAVAIGLPHQDLGAAVHAIVKPLAGTSLSECAVLDFLGDRLARYKLPRSFEFVGHELRDDAGKVRRQRLREERLV